MKITTNCLCGRRICINVEIAGRATDVTGRGVSNMNIEDKRPKGQGISEGMASLMKYDNALICRVRWCYWADKTPQKTLSREFGIDHSSVSTICRGLTRKHAGGPTKTSDVAIMVRPLEAPPLPK